MINSTMEKLSILFPLNSHENQNLNLPLRQFSFSLKKGILLSMGKIHIK